MSEAPPFWFQKPGLAAWLLSPFSGLYGQIATRRMQAGHSYVSSLPVFCVGNFIAGGAGKTPTAIALAKIARKMDLKPGFLSRGYGGGVNKPTLVDIRSHNAQDVGDEPLILAQYAPTVVSADRPAGARMLEEQNVDLIFMDDGFQNASLHKDYSLLVVDAGRGLGNGYCIPAGPMRAPLRPQLALASGLLLIGQSQAGTEVVRKAAKMAKPVLLAEIAVRKPQTWQGKKVLAYCGIASPRKFHKSLEECGAEIVETRNFHDHHPYTHDECKELLDLAVEKGLTLVTTEKDHMRLSRMGESQKALQSVSLVLQIDLKFENPKMVEVALRDTIKRAADFRLAKG